MTDSRDHMAGTWLAKREKRLLRLAAERCGISLSSFLRRSALVEIKRMISDGGDLADEEKLLDDLRTALVRKGND